MTYSIFELVKEVRRRITNAEPEPIRHALLNCYLLATRASETVYKPYGVYGSDVHEELVKNEETGQLEKVAVFHIRTAKKGGQVRYVAVPLNPEYEPLAGPLVNWYRKRGNKACFPFSRYTLNLYAKQVFAGLKYPIESYHYARKKTKVEPHQRDAAVHFLRHVRASELATIYNFNENQLRMFGGWAQAVMSGSSVILRYRQLSWKDYIQLLFMPTPYGMVQTA